MKSKDKLTKPTSGRVAGKGLSTKWGSYYTAGVRKEKKTSSESQAHEVQELKAQVLTAWIAGGQQGPPPIPSFTASNSQNAMAGPLVSPVEAALVPPTPARELNAPGCTQADTSAASGPSVNCTPAVGGASTLAELDAIITVTN